MPQVERITLYHYPATRSARAKWALHEVLGDAFDVKRVDIYGGEQYLPGYLGKNPNHAVPTLELLLEDGSVQHMVESGAMVAWLADAFPAAGLAPPAALTSERADFLQMLHFGATSMDMMLWQIRIHEHVLALDERDTRTLLRYRNKFRAEVEPQLKVRLSAQPFVCGERFSAADVMVGHSVLWARLYRLCQDEIFNDYASRLISRPAFQKAFADLSEFAPEVDPQSPIVAQFTG